MCPLRISVSVLPVSGSESVSVNIVSVSGDTVSPFPPPSLSIFLIFFLIEFEYMCIYLKVSQVYRYIILGLVFLCIIYVLCQVMRGPSYHWGET